MSFVLRFPRRSWTALFSHANQDSRSLISAKPSETCGLWAHLGPLKSSGKLNFTEAEVANAMQSLLSCLSKPLKRLPRQIQEQEYQDGRRFHSNTATSVEGVVWHTGNWNSVVAMQRLGIDRHDMVLFLIHGDLRSLQSTQKKQVEIAENKKTRLLEAAKSAKQLFWIQIKMRLQCHNVLLCFFTMFIYTDLKWTVRVTW